MSHLAVLISAYEKRGYRIQTSLNPAHFGGDRSVSFTKLLAGGAIQGTGGGLALAELGVLEALAERWQPQRVFVIGNAFGWSTLFLALLFPEARLVAIDNLTEGGDARRGFDLTRQLAEDLGVSARILEGSSPEDVAGVVERELGGIDLALVDGLHTDEQQWKDYQAIKPHLAEASAAFFHDVIDWKMLDSFRRIEADWPGGSAILHRTPSGMGLIHTQSLSEELSPILQVYVERELSRFSPAASLPLPPREEPAEDPGRPPGLPWKRRLKRRLKGLGLRR